MTGTTIAPKGSNSLTKVSDKVLNIEFQSTDLYLPPPVHRPHLIHDLAFTIPILKKLLGGEFHNVLEHWVSKKLTYTFDRILVPHFQFFGKWLPILIVYVSG